MNFARACFRRSLSALLLGGATLMPFHAANAQDSAFLACDRYTDRAQRIACLEDALEAATEAQEPSPAPAAPAVAAPAPAERPAATARPTNPAPAVTTAAPAAVAEEEEGPSLLDRLRNFGRDDTVSISTDTEGQDQLHDSITTLEKRRDLWLITLSSGQVWMQEYPRTLNLREGDQVTINQAGFGDGYRLSTERLSGFIRVKRMR